MSNLKSIFSRLLRSKKLVLPSEEIPTKSIEFPAALSTKYDIFQYLNFNIPELQPIKLSLELGKEEKAFEQFFKYLKMRHSTSFMCNWWKRDEIIQTLKTQYTEVVPPLLDAADHLLHHKFLLFSTHSIQAEMPIFWNRSYEEGANIDSSYWEPGKKYENSALLSDIHHDINFVWELNRHQHFLDLGKAYWYTGDEVYVEEFIDQIDSWIEQNPYPLSVNWVNSYEIALRGLFWLFGYAFFFSSHQADEDFFCRFYKSLLYHGHTIYQSLQTIPESLPVHQIVAQASFLYLLSTVFPEYRHSKLWNKTSWEILQWKSPLLELDMILHSNPASLTSSIELYCIVIAVRQNNRYHISQTITNGLTSMLERWALFIKPNGKLCGFGEEYPRQLTTGMYNQPHDFRYLLSMAALLLKNGKFAALGSPFDVSLLWYFSNDGLQKAEHLITTSPKTRQQQSCLIPDSTYALMRSGGKQENGYCLISKGLNGSHSPHPLKHSDLFSFELFANAQEYLIDCGPYSFHRTEEWNQYFRSSQAHNTITVDRISHINFHERHIESTFDQWITTPTFDFLSGYHDGFEDLEEPITHRRSIFYYKPNYWILCDLLTGEGKHFFDQYFHFPPFRLNIDFTNKCVNIQTNQTQHFLLMPFHPHEMDVSIFTGGEDPDSGWISRGYKKATEASFIKYGKQAMAPASFHTLFYAYHNDQAIKLSGRYLQALSQDKLLLSHEISALEISGDQETHYFAYLYESKYDVVEIDERILFSGRLFFLREQGHHILEIILYEATLLTIDDVTYFESKTPVESLTLQIEPDTLYVTCSGNYTFQMQQPEINQVFVNKRKTFLKHDGDMILVSTSRI